VVIYQKLYKFQFSSLFMFNQALIERDMIRSEVFELYCRQVQTKKLWSGLMDEDSTFTEPYYLNLDDGLSCLAGTLEIQNKNTTQAEFLIQQFRNAQTFGVTSYDRTRGRLIRRLITYAQVNFFHQHPVFLQDTVLSDVSLLVHEPNVNICNITNNELTKAVSQFSLAYTIGRIYARKNEKDSLMSEAILECMQISLDRIPLSTNAISLIYANSIPKV
jgi:hypothetical protein